MTMREFTHKHLSDIAFCFIGDTGSNMGTFLMVGAALIGMDIRLCGPQCLWPDAALVDQCRKLAEASGARITQTEDLTEGVEGCDYIYTDVWVSMGEPEDVWAERIALLSPFTVTQDVMDLTGNPHTKFLHCLPAFHNRDTKTGEKNFPDLWHRLHGGDGRGVRIRRLGRVRSGGEPAAFDQGGACRHDWRLKCASLWPLAAMPC
jgi:ornithine carbamoyltransferase